MNSSQGIGIGVVVAGEMFGEAFADFPGDVQAGEARVFLLDEIDDAEALAIVLEAAVFLHEFIEGSLAFVAERRMAEVVREGNGLGEVFVDRESAGNVARDASNFHRVREAGAEVVASAVQEDLRLVFEPAERARMDHAVAIALIMGAPFRGGFVMDASARVSAELRVGSEELSFALLQFDPGHWHGS